MQVQAHPGPGPGTVFVEAQIFIHLLADIPQNAHNSAWHIVDV